MATFIGDHLGVVTDDLYEADQHDVLYGLDGNDSLFPSTPAPLTIYGGDGDDTLVGGDDADELYGGRGEDNLVGVDGSDLLEGGSGNDRLEGGLGSDTVYGGKGADFFVFFFPDDIQDRVLDFDRKEGDLVQLAGETFNELTPGEPLDPEAFYTGKKAEEKDDHIGYDQKSGKMYYDANGDKSGGSTLFAQFDKGTKIKVSDIDVLPIGVG